LLFFFAVLLPFVVNKDYHKYVCHNVQYKYVSGGPKIIYQVYDISAYGELTFR